MRFTIFLFYILFSSWNSSIAQSGSISWNTSFKVALPADVAFTGKEPSTKNTFWVITEGQSRSLVKLDSANNKIFSKKIDLRDSSRLAEGKSVGIVNSIILKDRIAIFALSCHTKKSNCEAFVHQMTFDGVEISTNKEVFQLKGKGLSEFELKLSPDSSKIALFENIQNQKETGKNGFFIRIYDAQFNLLHSKDLYTAANSDLDFDKVELDELTLTNNAEVYLLGRKFDLKNDETVLGIWRVLPQKKGLEEMKFEIPGFELDNGVCKMNAFGELLLAGFYYKEDTANSDKRAYEGTFFGKLDTVKKSVEFLKIATLPAGSEQLTTKEYMTDKLLTSVVKEDGGLILMVESVFLLKEQEHLGSVFIVNYERTGAINYFSSVAKDDHRHLLSYGVEYSFFPVYNGVDKSLKIVFNENPLNWNLVDEKKRVPMVYPSKSIPIMVSFDKEGKMSKEKLLNTGVVPSILCPSLSKQMNSNKVIIFGIQKSDLVVGGLVFK